MFIGFSSLTCFSDTHCRRRPSSLMGSKEERGFVNLPVAISMRAKDAYKETRARHSVRLAVSQSIAKRPPPSRSCDPAEGSYPLQRRHGGERALTSLLLARME